MTETKLKEREVQEKPLTLSGTLGREVNISIGALRVMRDTFTELLEENPRATIVMPFVLAAYMGSIAAVIGDLTAHELYKNYESTCYYDRDGTADSSPLCAVGATLMLPTNKDYRRDIFVYERDQSAERLPAIQQECKDKLGKWRVGVHNYEFISVDCADNNGDGVPESILLTGGSANEKYDLQTGERL